MPLTETQAKNAKPRERAYKLADSEGLFLLVQPNGTRLWRMKYRFAGKENCCRSELIRRWGSQLPGISAKPLRRCLPRARIR